MRIGWVLSLLLLAGLIAFYRGFEADFRVGNVNSIQLLLIGLMLMTWSRASALAAPEAVATLGGVLAGLLLVFKPNVMYVVLLLAFARLVSRQFRRLALEAAGALGGAVIAFIAATINYRTPRVWLQWMTAANQFWYRLQTRNERNVAPALELFRDYGVWLSHVLALLLIIIVGVAIYTGRRGVVDDGLVVGSGLLIYLLSSPVVWLHYMVLVIPLAIALLRWRWTAVVALCALAAIAEEPFEMVFRTPVYPRDAMLIGPALVALFVCAVWRIGVPQWGAAEASVPRHPA
jgi:hypothetical protein